MLIPWRWWILTGNILIVLSSALGVFSLFTIFPMLQIVFNDGEEAHPASAIVSQQTVESPATQHKHKHKNDEVVKSPGWWKELKVAWDTRTDAIKDRIEREARENPLQLIYFLCVRVFALATIVRAGLDYASRACIVQVQIGFMRAMTYRLYSHAMRHDIVFFQWNSAGRLMQRIYNDVMRLGTLIGLTYGKRIRQPIEFVFLAALLLMVHLYLGLIVLLVLPLMLLPGIWISRGIRKVSEKEVGVDANIMELMQEQFNGIGVIKGMTAEDYETRRFKENVEGMFDRRRKRAYLLAVNAPIIDTPSPPSASSPASSSAPKSSSRPVDFRPPVPLLPHRRHPHVQTRQTPLHPPGRHATPPHERPRHLPPPRHRTPHRRSARRSRLSRELERDHLREGLVPLRQEAPPQHRAPRRRRHDPRRTIRRPRRRQRIGQDHLRLAALSPLRPPTADASPSTVTTSASSRYRACADTSASSNSTPSSSTSPRRQNIAYG